MSRRCSLCNFALGERGCPEVESSFFSHGGDHSLQRRALWWRWCQGADLLVRSLCRGPWVSPVSLCKHSAHVRLLGRTAPQAFLSALTGRGMYALAARSGAGVSPPVFSRSTLFAARRHGPAFGGHDRLNAPAPHDARPGVPAACQIFSKS